MVIKSSQWPHPYSAAAPHHITILLLETLKALNYRHERFTLHTAFLIGSSFHSTNYVLFTINGLGTALSPWVKTRWPGWESDRSQTL